MLIGGQNKKKNHSITLHFNYLSSVNLHFHGKVSGSLLYFSELQETKNFIKHSRGKLS